MPFAVEYGDTTICSLRVATHPSNEAERVPTTFVTRSVLLHLE